MIHEHDLDHDDKPCGCGHKKGEPDVGHALGGPIPAGVAGNLEAVADALRRPLDPGMAELAEILRSPTNVAVEPSAKVVARTAVLNPPATGVSPWQVLVQPSPDLLAVTVLVMPVVTGGSNGAFVYFTADPNLLVPDLGGTSEASGIATVLAGDVSFGITPPSLRITTRSGLWLASSTAVGTVEGVLVSAIAEYRD